MHQYFTGMDPCKRKWQACHAAVCYAGYFFIAGPMISQFHKTGDQLDSEKLQVLKAQDDPNAFEPLYNQYFERLYKFVYQRLENKEEASDLTSQVFLKALVNLKQFRFRDVPFSAWLFRIAINEINNFYTRSKKSRVVNIETMKLNELLEESNSDLKEERIARIISEIKNLKGADLLLIEMRFFENRSFREIGEIMKITENNAKVRVYRVLARMKQNIL
jgi:RNA polymerase sigma-70 factor (ECF subfamily)